jgi:ABC-type sugar transport system ATPase subunit
MINPADEARFGIESAYHHYSGVVVLADVDFELRGGEVHALLGENGSGKSTLIRILTGALKPSGGKLTLDGETVSFSVPADARAQGIGVVHQDYHLFPELTVAQNVYGVSVSLPRRRWTQTVDRLEVERRVERLFAELRIDIPSTRLVRSLDAAERKFVEIARAMLLKPRFLVLDEPTASLEPAASRSVLDLLRRLREQGVGLMFVSHRLDEVRTIADRISVLRDGRVVERIDPQDATEDRMANAITGGVDRTPTRVRVAPAQPTTALRIEGVRLSAERPPVSLEVRRGEIFGLTGLLGSGAATLIRMIGGAQPLPGEAWLDGEPVVIRTPRNACALGIGFIPEDRKAVGLIQDQSIATNISLASLGAVSRMGVLSRARIATRADDYKERLSIRATSVNQPVAQLSGGNQQKVLLAKWLASGVRLLAVEEPTHGIDIGGKAQVHELLREFADQGGTVVVASTDAGEVLDLCDRIGVMRHGGLTKIVAAAELSRAAVTAIGARDAEDILDQLIDSDDPDLSPAGRSAQESS